jgi:hypothetical protein
MNLFDLTSACQIGVCITVASSRNGRILIQNAMKSTGPILNLKVEGIEAKIRIGGGGNFGRAYLYCYANEDEYKNLKKQQEDTL